MKTISIKQGFRPRQRGAVAIMVGFLIVALIGFLGIVLDLGNLYVRKTELQNAADAAALAGARQLNGSAEGIDRAVASAIALAAENASDFGNTAVAISGAQIRFGLSPDGAWSDQASARASPTNMRFIKVDSSGIAQGTRPTWFMPVVDAALASTTTIGVAVAGAAVCEGVPIFICLPAAGSFKPGQAYFFGEKPGYPVGPGDIGYFDPVPPGAPSMITGADEMRDFMCAGKMFCIAPGNFSSLSQNAFGTMARAINTRFDDFKSLPSSLTAEVCRPDTNIKEYPDSDLRPASKAEAWMTPPPDRQSECDTSDPLYPANCSVPPTPLNLGVHWSAVRPTGAALVGVAASANSQYPTIGTPYSQPVGSIFHQQPSVAHRSSAEFGRRILTMAIADNCGSINGSGKPVHVIGFGRFFMPIAAVGTGGHKGIYVEYIETVSTPPNSPPDIKLYR
jgi:Flp pilus assembly protein TadG